MCKIELFSECLDVGLVELVHEALVLPQQVVKRLMIDACWRIKEKEISWCLEAANKQVFASTHESSVFNDFTVYYQ